MPIAPQMGKTILISSHILTELAEICDRVAIIEHGQLVAVGTVDEISRCVEEEINVRVRVVERDSTSGQETAAAWLAKHEHVDRVASTKDGVTFTVMAEATHRDESLAKLLAEMVDAGIAVIEFTSRGKSLEDVFLHVTKGRVQ